MSVLAIASNCPGIFFHRHRARGRCFAALGIHRIAGRDLTEHDDAGAPRVATINRIHARAFLRPAWRQ
jgi:hypothetical protein